jgi:hypothetical protein
MIGDALLSVVIDQLGHQFGASSALDARLLAVAGFDVTALSWALGHIRELGPLWWPVIGALSTSLTCYLVGVAPTSFEFGPRFPPGKARAALQSPAIDVYEGLISNYEGAKFRNRVIVNRKARMFRLATGVLVVPPVVFALYWIAWFYGVL